MIVPVRIAAPPPPLSEWTVGRYLKVRGIRAVYDVSNDHYLLKVEGTCTPHIAASGALVRFSASMLVFVARAVHMRARNPRGSVWIFRDQQIDDSGKEADILVTDCGWGRGLRIQWEWFDRIEVQRAIAEDNAEPDEGHDNVARRLRLNMIPVAEPMPW